ncbi:hypothetical protein DPMN_060037, partial [Dreissena polymorpha]
VTGHAMSGHRSLTGPVTGQAVTGLVTGHRSLTGPVTGHVMTDPVTGFRSVPQTVPVTVDVDAAAFLL